MLRSYSLELKTGFNEDATFFNGILFGEKIRCYLLNPNLKLN